MRRAFKKIAWWSNKTLKAKQDTIINLQTEITQRSTYK